MSAIVGACRGTRLQRRGAAPLRWFCESRTRGAWFGGRRAEVRVGKPRRGGRAGSSVSPTTLGSERADAAASATLARDVHAPGPRTRERRLSRARLVVVRVISWGERRPPARVQTPGVARAVQSTRGRGAHRPRRGDRRRRGGEAGRQGAVGARIEVSSDVGREWLRAKSPWS